MFVAIFLLCLSGTCVPIVRHYGLSVSWVMMQIFRNLVLEVSLITSSPVVLQNIAISMSVCLSVCVSVCSHISKNYMSNFHEIFCMCYLWPWLSAPSMMMQYVMHFQFCECRLFSYIGVYTVSWCQWSWWMTCHPLSERYCLTCSWQQMIWLDGMAGALLQCGDQVSCLWLPCLVMSVWTIQVGVSLLPRDL